jgi:thioredoxin 1
MKPRSLVAALSLAVTCVAAQAVTLVPYSAKAVQDAQNAGSPHAIHFHADWCSTCVSQEKVLKNLNSDKDVDLPVFVANYDKETELKKQHNIRSQSVLVVFRGKQEQARLAGETKPEAIKSALKKAF